MGVTFWIHYETTYGEDLQWISGAVVESMIFAGGGWWTLTTQAPANTPYHYRVVRGPDVVACETGPPRTTPHEAATMVDRWRVDDPARAARQSALFTGAVAAQHRSAGVGPPAPSADPNRGQATFRLLEPAVPPGLRPAVVGSGTELGDWQVSAAIPMQPGPFPWWEASVAPPPEPTAYKYVLVTAEGSVVRWEDGPDRQLRAVSAGVVVNDDEFRGLPGWRGAGIAVPVFSLRTAASVGVGQFSDLVPLVDWVASIGMSMIQLLPVNDTVQHRGWDDSYPYDPVSVHALHPVYVDLSAVPGADAEEIDRVRAALEGLPAVDYPAVFEHKWRLLRTAFETVEPDLADHEEFVAFVAAERAWLEPYSVWCALRDYHRTTDTRSWGPDATHQPDRVAAYAERGSSLNPDVVFHQFVQFHLHRQLDAAVEHARSKGVALKGDLPIGVSPSSAEVWIHPEDFHLGTQTGAPPDGFSADGQNWQFPTYDWDHMARDSYRWWKDRFGAMARFVDAYRIDHVLGFFRIWEIPGHAISGLLGHFRPCLPLGPADVTAAVASVELEHLLEPLVDTAVLQRRFGTHADLVRQRFFAGPDHALTPGPEMATQRQLVTALADEPLTDLAPADADRARRELLAIIADPLMLAVEDGYHPRIDWASTERYQRLPEHEQQAFDRLALDFFHHRHRDQWAQQGLTSLRAVLGATELLACGEDLGMVPDFVPPLMRRLGLLSLEIERMPKALGQWLADPASAPYLSVVSPGTHDMATLRQWWRDDPAVAARYWYEVLGWHGAPAADAPADLCEAIVARQLQSPAMLSVIPLADLFAIDDHVRRDDPAAERINDPADRHNHWSYRMHLTIEELAAAEAFNDRVRALVRLGGRERS